MGMYLRRMNLTQACARRVKGNLAEVLLDNFFKRMKHLKLKRILCEQFSVPNHPKMGMYLRRMNLTQACTRRVKGNLAEVLLDSFSKG